MPLISWTTKIKRFRVTNQRLLVALRSQNYEAIESGGVISATMPKTLGDFIKNGMQLFLVERILVTPESETVRLQIMFRSSVVGFCLVCIVAGLWLSLMQVAPQDFSKALMGFLIVIPIGILITVGVLVSTIKRDVKNAAKAAAE